MVDFDDGPASKPKFHVIGEDLSDLSLEDLGERIEQLKTEIGRLQEAMSGKEASAAAAETFFKR